MSGDLNWVTWLLVIVGWIFVDRSNDKRETRKEARSAIDAAKKEVLSISAAAVAYFTDLANKGSDEIKSSLDVLEVELERLRNYPSSELARRMSAFHEACTGGDFELAARTVHAKTSAEVQAILLARNRLVGQLEKHFRAVYL